MLLRVEDLGERAVGLEEHAHAGIRPAVLDLLRREPPGQRYEDGAEPLAGPEELHGLAAVPGDRRDAVSRRHAPLGEAVREPRRQVAQRRVREPDVAVDERLGVGSALGRVEKGQCEIHRGCSAASRIASTIGS